MKKGFHYKLERKFGLCRSQIRLHVLCSLTLELHSSFGSMQVLRLGGYWLDPHLGQYSFRGLMIMIATGFVPLSPLSIVSLVGCIWFNTALTAKVISWRPVTHMCSLVFSH